MPLAYGLGGLISVPQGAVTGRGAPPASFKGELGQQYFDTSTTPPTGYTYNGSTWAQGGNVQATETVAGIAELSTLAEALAGTNDTTIMTPLKVGAVAIAGAPDWSEVTKGILEKATTAEAQAGVDDTVGMSPLKTFQALATPPAIGSTTPAAGTFTSLTADGTGTVTLTSNAASVYDVTGAGNDLTLSSDAGRVIVNGEEAAANAITLLTAAGGIDVDAALQIHIQTTQSAADSLVLTSTAGGIDILASGAAAGEDIDIIATGSSVNIRSTESAADSITITSTAGGIDILATGAAAGEDIDIIATGSSVNIQSTEAVADAINIDSSGGFDLDAAGQVNIASSQNAADSIVITSSAGGIDILAAGAAAGEDIDIIATGSSVNIESTEDAALAVYLHANGGTSETIRLRADQGTGVASIDVLSDVGGITLTAGLGSADAINLVTSAAGGGIDIDSGTAGFIVDTTGGISLDSAGASNFTATGAFNLTVNTTAGSLILAGGVAAADAINMDAAAGGLDVDVALQMNLDSSQAAANAVRIIASNAAGGIDVDAGTGGITIDTTGALSLDSAGTTNLTTTGAFDLTIQSTAGSVIVSASEDAADAVQILSTAGGIDILATGAAAQDIDIVNTGGSVNISATESAADSITITSTAGGIDILASGAAAGEDIDIIATGSSVNISATESAADSITIVSTAGGIDILASGAAAGEDIDIVATGSSINITSTENVTDAIVITASGAASAFQVDAGTGSFRIGTGLVIPSTAVNNAASPYTVLGTDYFIAVDSSAGAVTVTLPAATALAGRTFVIRDVGGAAAANNITIGGGGTNLVGGAAAAASKVLSAAYSGATVISDGTVWAYAYVA